MTARYRGTCRYCSRVFVRTFATPYDEFGIEDAFSVDCGDCDQAESMVYRDDYVDGEDHLTIEDIAIGYDAAIVARCEDVIGTWSRGSDIKRVNLGSSEGWVLEEERKHRPVFISVFEAIGMDEDDLATLVRDRLDHTENVYA